MADYSRPVTPENGINGTNGVQTPRTPKNTSFALTEYSANPSPPNESTKAAAQQVIPEAFLLPNGYPDVWQLPSVSNTAMPTYLHCFSISASSLPPASTKSSKKHHSPQQ
jgi:hypothetical protein